MDPHTFIITRQVGARQVDLSQTQRDSPLTYNAKHTHFGRWAGTESNHPEITFAHAIALKEGVSPLRTITRDISRWFEMAFTAYVEFQTQANCKKADLTLKQTDQIPNRNSDPTLQKIKAENKMSNGTLRWHSKIQNDALYILIVQYCDMSLYRLDSIFSEHALGRKRAARAKTNKPTKIK